MKKVHHNILAMGFTDVSASGAISESQFDTFPGHPTGLVVDGFVVYAFNDNLQSQSPLFVKLEYGTERVPGSPTAANFLTVGYGHDGSGSFTGSRSQRIDAVWTHVAAAPLMRQLWFMGGDGTGDDAYLCVAGNCGNLQQNSLTIRGGVFSVERPKDVTGSNTPDGFHIFAQDGVVDARWLQTVYQTGSAFAPLTNFPSITGIRDPATKLGKPTVSPLLPMVHPHALTNAVVTMATSYRNLDIFTVEL
jgi:hypothetical protein